jgi:hypothetical protein
MLRALRNANLFLQIDRSSAGLVEKLLKLDGGGRRAVLCSVPRAV